MTPRGLRLLCYGPETPTQWKSERVTNQQTDRLTGEESAGDAHAYTSKIKLISKNHFRSFSVSVNLSIGSLPKKSHGNSISLENIQTNIV